MRYTTTHSYDGMGEFLFRKLWDGELEPDGDFRDDMGQGFAQFGRRIIIDADGGPIEYERYDTIGEACQRFDELRDARPPMEYDAIIGEDRGRYVVSLEGSDCGVFDDRDDAELALAQAMVDAGCFPDAFFVNDRGNWHRIDDDIRALHDDGGDKMRPDLVEAQR